MLEVFVSGLVSLIVCKITIDAERKNHRWERFVSICSEFDKKQQNLSKAVAEPGDVVSSEINHEELSTSNQEKILFLLSEVEKLSEQEKFYEEVFFTIYGNELGDILHLLPKYYGVKLKLNQSRNNIFELEKTGEPKNKMYLNAQKLLLNFKEFRET